MDAVNLTGDCAGFIWAPRLAECLKEFEVMCENAKTGAPLTYDQLAAHRIKYREVCDRIYHDMWEVHAMDQGVQIERIVDEGR